MVTPRGNDRIVSGVHYVAVVWGSLALKDASTAGPDD